MDWDKMEGEVDRTDIERQTYKILDIEVPHVTIPVRPGRDIARLIEVAALDQKLKSLGHNAAREFNERLIERMRTPGGS
jgi:HPr kinase/phosphorylase